MAAPAREPPRVRVRVRWAGARAMHVNDSSQQVQLPASLPSLAPLQPLSAERAAAGAPGVAHIAGNCVAFVARGAPVVERSFVFPERVRDAVFARFDSRNHHHEQLPEQQQQPHLCVLVRADCVNIYAPSGEVFEAALPFQASRLFALGAAGLLLQRSPVPNQPPSPGRSQRTPDALFVDRELASRPRFFTLAHPLDEVKPVALAAAGKDSSPSGGASASSPPLQQFVSDPALELVAFCAPEALLTCYHTDNRCFHVFRLRPAPADPAPRVAAVRVVDSATWRKHRENEAELEVLDRVAISPDWIATLVWTSPVMERRLSTGVNRFAEPSLNGTTRSAFVTSALDLGTILCMMDRSAGVLLLKRVDSLPRDHCNSSTTNTDHGKQATNSSDDVKIIRCRDAVPISFINSSTSRGDSAEPQKRPIDIVVHEAEGEFRLHRGEHPICSLLPPSAQDFSEVRHWSPTASIRTTGADDSSFEVRGHNPTEFAETLNRVEHPLRFEFSPLLEDVFRVLECVLPPPISLELRAKVVAEHQQVQAASSIGGSSTGAGSTSSEWSVFCGLVAEQLDSANSSDRDPEAVRKLASGPAPRASTEMSAFAKLCQSSFHKQYVTANPMLFADMDDAPALPTRRVSKPQELSSHTSAVLRPHAAKLFAGLHLLHEDLKLSVASSQNRQQLAELLLDMATHLDLEAYTVYYQQETGQPPHSVANVAADMTTLFDGWDNTHVPDIMSWIQLKIQAFGCSQTSSCSTEPSRFPRLPNTTSSVGLGTFDVSALETPLWRTDAICCVYELLVSSHYQLRTGSVSSDTEGQDRADADNRASLMAFLTQDSFGARLPLWDLPFGVQFPVVDAIREFRHAPPPFVTEDICHFIGREDLVGVASSHTSSLNLPEHVQSQYGRATSETGYRDESQQQQHDVSDGLEEMIQLSRSLFPADQRTKEVARLVRSSRPLCLKLEKSLDMSDQDFVQQQQARLLLLCKRSMSLSVARGMVTLGSFDVSMAQNHAWQLRIPELPLAGRTPPTNATVALDVSNFAKELMFWPQFHNGCAAGLRLPARDLSSVVNRYWIKYHRPSVAEHHARQAARSSASQQTSPSPESIKRSLEEAYAAHAGLLLGLGLRGHLKCLSMADVYNYLSLSNELVTVAILLGMATTAAHCRQVRKSQTQMIKKSKSRSSRVSSIGSSSASPPLEEERGVGIDDVSLQDEAFMPGATSKAPLVGSGLELTLERSVSKMLCLHIPSLLPPPFAEFSVPASTQTAALLGLGILYRGTGHRLMTELLLTEIARSPSSAQFVSNNSNSGLSTASFDQLEGYALAAGLALGLVILGRGNAKSGDPGLADMKLEEKLHKYLTGGAQQFGDTNAAGGCLYRGRKWETFGAGMSSGAGGGGEYGSSLNGGSGSAREPRIHQGARGEYVNTGVTAYGSALALAFMYMKTENKSVAAQLAVPDTLILLDSVRPDILMVRTLAKNLVLWDSVEPTVEWIEDAQVPEQLAKAYKALQRDPKAVAAANRDSLGTVTASVHADPQSICEAYANVVAGACFSIGFRFAGTSDSRARKTLRKYIVHFREMRLRSASGVIAGFGNAIAAATERVTVERCLAVCAQALALVDAGSGNVETLALLRSINLRQRVDSDTTYGNHMALSSAIGLLFVGGGRATVSRSKEAIAALVVSLFPMYPMNTADNKYHLQAFRHLYVLAVDTSRLLETIDVNSGSNCSVPVRLELRRSHTLSASGDSRFERWQTLQSPCLLPDLGSIKRILVSRSEFYPVEIIMSRSKKPVQAAPGRGKTGSAVGSGSQQQQQQQQHTANALRLDLLRSRNVILLKRTKQHEHTEGLASISRELSALKRHEPITQLAGDKDDRLVEAFQSYFLRSSGRTHDTEAEVEKGADSHFATWWHTQCQELVAHHAREEASSFLPIYLNTLHALFRLQQQHSSMTTSFAGLRSLKLYTDYCEVRRLARPRGVNEELISDHPFFHHDSQHSTDFVVWLKLQTEQALKAQWEKCSIDVTSSADVHALVRQARIGKAEEDALSADAKIVVNALVQYFAPPGLKIAAVEGDRAVVEYESSANMASSTSEDTAANQEAKTFWLQLESFFLFG